jgi:heat shock protein HslJ
MLEGTVWQLSGFGGGDDEVVAPDQPGDYTITFNEEGAANIEADCNNVSDTFATNDPEITIEFGASTLVACDEALISDRFTGWLETPSRSSWTATTW